MIITAITYFFYKEENKKELQRFDSYLLEEKKEFFTEKNSYSFIKHYWESTAFLVEDKKDCNIQYMFSITMKM